VKILVRGIMQRKANCDSKPHKGQEDRHIAPGIVEKKPLYLGNLFHHQNL
jgi:hypothetical protein